MQKEAPAQALHPASNSALKTAPALKTALLFLSLGVLLLLLSCGYEYLPPPNETIDVSEQASRVLNRTNVSNQTESGDYSETQEASIRPRGGDPCTYTAECAEAYYECVNGKCQSLEDLYSFSCPQKCTLKNVTVSTSDGGTPETYKPGQGSYTAAGGLDWDVLRLPEHCPAADPLIAFQLTYKKTGAILGESIVTVEEGQESNVITHPALPSVKFRLKVEKAEVEC